jgi:hypothetical protein
VEDGVSLVAKVQLVVSEKELIKKQIYFKIVIVVKQFFSFAIHI